MYPREREKIIEICHEADILVTEGPGSSDWEVLERKRLHMNDLLIANRLQEALNVAYCITLLWFGNAKDADYF